MFTTLCPTRPSLLEIKISATLPTLLCSVLLSGHSPGLNAQSVSFLGSQTVLASNLLNPQGTAVDSSGNVYVVDAGNKRVVRIMPGASPDCSSGCISVAEGLSAPTGIALSSSGDLFVTDSAAGQVVKISSEGALSTIISLPDPQGIAVNATGDLLVALGGGELVQVTPSGVVSPITTSLSSPKGVAIDASGNIYVVDGGSNQVVRISPEGGRTVVATGLNAPSGLSIDSAGLLYIADSANDRIVKVPAAASNIDCTRSCSALGSGLIHPTGICADGRGTVYVSDASSQTISISSSVDFGIASVGATIPIFRTLLYGLVTSDCSAIGSVNVLTRGSLNQDFTSMSSANVCAFGSPNTLSVTVEFLAHFAGVRNGSVQLTGGNGTLQAITYIHGVGSAPQLTWTPGVTSIAVGP